MFLGGRTNGPVPTLSSSIRDEDTVHGNSAAHCALNLSFLGRYSSLMSPSPPFRRRDLMKPIPTTPTAQFTTVPACSRPTSSRDTPLCTCVLGTRKQCPRCDDEMSAFATRQQLRTGCLHPTSRPTSALPQQLYQFLLG